MSRRTIEALRALAERPGTEHEGIVARLMLERLEAKQRDSGDDGYRDYEAEYLAKFRAHMRGEISLDEFLQWSRGHDRQAASAEVHKCACGCLYRDGEKCLNELQHAVVQTKIRTTFAKGDRVCYNYWAYPPNCPGTVQGYVKLQPDNGTFPWAWIRVKFDHLKTPRNVPIWTEKGLHLSHEPLPDSECERLDPLGFGISQRSIARRKTA